MAATTTSRHGRREQHAVPRIIITSQGGLGPLLPDHLLLLVSAAAAATARLFTGQYENLTTVGYESSDNAWCAWSF